jgi:hypothetical protein
MYGTGQPHSEGLSNPDINRAKAEKPWFKGNSYK